MKSFPLGHRRGNQYNWPWQQDRSRVADKVEWSGVPDEKDSAEMTPPRKITKFYNKILTVQKYDKRVVEINKIKK